jgi:hypothetical protein
MYRPPSTRFDMPGIVAHISADKIIKRIEVGDNKVHAYLNEDIYSE